MKNLLCILLFLPFISFGQNKTDTIFYANGEVEGIEIIEIDDNNIKFKYPGEPFTISTSNKKVQKIKTLKGRIIHFESSIKKSVFTVKDWEKVEITNLNSDLEGLNRVSNVTGKAKGMTTLSSSDNQKRLFNSETLK